MKHSAIIQAAADYFGVTPDDILSPKRDRRTVTARHVACYVMRQLCIKPTYGEISSALGRLSHVSSLHGVRNIEHMMSKDQRFLDAVCGIIERTNSTAI